MGFLKPIRTNNGQDLYTSTALTESAKSANADKLYFAIDSNNTSKRCIIMGGKRYS